MLIAAAIRMEKYGIFIHELFFQATRNEETSEDSEEDKKYQDIWEQQQMRRAVKITEVIIFYAICISFLWLL